MSLLTIILMFVTAFFLFTRLYRITLAWFVRSRVDRRWEGRARVMATAASVPLAITNSFFLLNGFFFIAQLIIDWNIAGAGLKHYLKVSVEYENLLFLLFTLIFLARMAPQTIASSKLFAYSMEFKAESQEENEREEIPK